MALWERGGGLNLLSVGRGTPRRSSLSLSLPVAVFKFGDGLGVQSCLHVAEDDRKPSILRDLGAVHHVAHAVRHLVLPMVPKLTRDLKSGEWRHMHAHDRAVSLAELHGS